MQPDLLSPEKEETQLETSPSEETANGNPSPVGKKRSKLSLAYFVLGILVLLLLAAFAWVGYWAYDLSTQLLNSQQQLAALQGEHAQLKTDYAALKNENEKLNTELTQTKVDLEKANADLTTAKSDLSTAQGQNKSLNAQIDKASKLAEILYTFDTIKNEIDLLQLDKLIRDSKNQQLLTQWKSISSEEDFRNFLAYLILATRDSLK